MPDCEQEIYSSFSFEFVADNMRRFLSLIFKVVVILTIIIILGLYTYSWEVLAGETLLIVMLYILQRKFQMFQKMFKKSLYTETIPHFITKVFELKYFIHTALTIGILLLAILIWINRYSYVMGGQGEAWRINNFTGKGCAIDAYTDRGQSLSSNKLIKNFNNCIKVSE